MINFSIDENSHIVRATYNGDISIYDIEEYYRSLIKITNLPKNLRILQDERVGNFIDSDRIIDKIVQMLPLMVERFTTVRIAIWQTKPLETAYSKLFIGQIKTKNVAVAVFYTQEAALGWL